jgi:hypothetical protein
MGTGAVSEAAVLLLGPVQPRSTANGADQRRFQPTPPVRYLPLPTTIDRWQETPKPRVEGSNPSAPAMFLAGVCIQNQ